MLYQVEPISILLLIFRFVTDKRKVITALFNNFIIIHLNS